MAGQDRERLRDHPDPDLRRARAVFALLVLAALTVITLDARPDDSPVEPMRTATGAVVGPLQAGTASMVRDVAAVQDRFADVDALQAANTELRQQNAILRAQVRASEHAQSRAEQLDRILQVADRHDISLVPAQVVTLGAAQTFSRTATIDAGRRDGVLPDMTVLNGDGLVGRVISADRHTATLLLAIDGRSVVGGRLGADSELGFVSGDGNIGDDGRLLLELVDRSGAPTPGDVVVTWGSRNDAPYIPGVPIGSVVDVQSSPREMSTTATVRPFVDFSSLDLVGVVAGTGRQGGRDAIEASR